MLKETPNGNMRIKKCVYFLIVLIFTSTLGYMLMGVMLDREFRQHRKLEDFRAPYLHGNNKYFGRDLLEDLGFVRNPRLYPQSYHDQAEDLPVFVSAVTSEGFEDFMEMVYTQRLHFPDKKLVVYNLDLSTEQIQTMRENCRCVVRDFRWKRFPNHLQNKIYKAYRPIIIQESLMEFGAIFWADRLTRFTSSEVYNLLGQAERAGLVAWTLAYPTTSLTHPNMFRYFNYSLDNYQMLQMVEADRLVVYNTENIHNNLMLPWVKCALDSSCIAPPGAQSRGCNFTLKPKHLYAGCHMYDTSAFNVVLGQTFKFEQPYLAIFDIFDIAKPTAKLKKRRSG